MPDNHRKPGVAFWATVVVAVGLTYLLSFGLVCLIWGRNIESWPRLFAIYEPCLGAVESGPESVRWTLRQSTRWCGGQAGLNDILTDRMAQRNKDADIEEFRRYLSEMD